MARLIWQQLGHVSGEETGRRNGWLGAFRPPLRYPCRKPALLCKVRHTRANLRPTLSSAAAGATNRPDALDPALRRAGRFDREIAVGIPTEAARASILRVLARRLRLSGDFDFAAVAKRTPGFVGADLQVCPRRVDF